jgi:flavodoxin
MKALVVYDSYYGNTEAVGRAIGEALGQASGTPADVQTMRVGDVRPEQLTGLDALVVGSPTRAFQATPPVKAFLRGIPAGALNGVRVAAFDTRVDAENTGPAILRFLARLFGYAAEPIAKRLRRMGGQQAAPPAGFVVLGTEGPLQEGELERAAEWARGIGQGFGR